MLLASSPRALYSHQQVGTLYYKQVQAKKKLLLCPQRAQKCTRTNSFFVGAVTNPMSTQSYAVYNATQEQFRVQCLNALTFDPTGDWDRLINLQIERQPTLSLSHS